MGRNSSSYVCIHVKVSRTGGAAEQAAERKRAKYANLPATRDFTPLAIESLEPINITEVEFLQDLGQRITDATGDPRETTYLFQRLSICTQRFNAAAFQGSFE